MSHTGGQKPPEYGETSLYSSLSLPSRMSRTDILKQVTNIHARQMSLNDELSVLLQERSQVEHALDALLLHTAHSTANTASSSSSLLPESLPLAVSPHQLREETVHLSSLLSADAQWLGSRLRALDVTQTRVTAAAQRVEHVTRLAGIADRVNAALVQGKPEVAAKFVWEAQQSVLADAAARANGNTGTGKSTSGKIPGASTTSPGVSGATTSTGTVTTHGSSQNDVTGAATSTSTSTSTTASEGAASAAKDATPATSASPAHIVIDSRAWALLLALEARVRTSIQASLVAAQAQLEHRERTQTLDANDEVFASILSLATGLARVGGMGEGARAYAAAVGAHLEAQVRAAGAHPSSLGRGTGASADVSGADGEEVTHADAAAAIANAVAQALQLHRKPMRVHFATGAEVILCQQLQRTCDRLLSSLVEGFIAKVQLRARTANMKQVSSGLNVTPPAMRGMAAAGRTHLHGHSPGNRALSSGGGGSGGAGDGHGSGSEERELDGIAEILENAAAVCREVGIAAQLLVRAGERAQSVLRVRAAKEWEAAVRCGLLEGVLEKVNVAVDDSVEGDREGKGEDGGVRASVLLGQVWQYAQTFPQTPLPPHTPPQVHEEPHMQVGAEMGASSDPSLRDGMRDGMRDGILLRVSAAAHACPATTLLHALRTHNTQGDSIRRITLAAEAAQELLGLYVSLETGLVTVAMCRALERDTVPGHYPWEAAAGVRGVERIDMEEVPRLTAGEVFQRRLKEGGVGSAVGDCTHVAAASVERAVGTLDASAASAVVNHIAQVCGTQVREYYQLEVGYYAAQFGTGSSAAKARESAGLAACGAPTYDMAVTALVNLGHVQSAQSSGSASASAAFRLALGDGAGLSGDMAMGMGGGMGGSGGVNTSRVNISREAALAAYRLIREVQLVCAANAVDAWSTHVLLLRAHIEKSVASAFGDGEDGETAITGNTGTGSSTVSATALPEAARAIQLLNCCAQAFTDVSADFGLLSKRAVHVLASTITPRLRAPLEELAQTDFLLDEQSLAVCEGQASWATSLARILHSEFVTYANALTEGPLSQLSSALATHICRAACMTIDGNGDMSRAQRFTLLGALRLDECVRSLVAAMSESGGVGGGIRDKFAKLIQMCLILQLSSVAEVVEMLGEQGNGFQQWRISKSAALRLLSQRTDLAPHARKELDQALRELRQ